MKRNRLWLVGALVMASALLTVALYKTRQQPLWILAHYPRTPAYNDYLSFVQLQATMAPADSNTLFSIAYPASDDFNRMISCQVDNRGYFSVGNLNLGQAGQSYNLDQNLSSVQLEESRKLLRDLPPNSPPADRKDLLVIIAQIAQDAPHKEIRLYDKNYPPAQIKEICHLITMPLRLS